MPSTKPPTKAAPEPTAHKKPAVQRRMGNGAPETSPESAFHAAASGRGPLTEGEMLALQGTAGNRAVTGLIQAKRARVDDTSQVHEAAKRGTGGPGVTLPHLATIQKSFGRHDVTGVVAHTGAQATAGANAMGAAAFAMGNHVAFAGSADLHTAAHEAAHVIQQRGGVQLAGGVGQVGDKYEMHADAVAAGVVQGRSVEGLLDQFGSADASRRRQVQGLVAGPRAHAPTDQAAAVQATPLHVGVFAVEAPEAEFYTGASPPGGMHGTPVQRTATPGATIYFNGDKVLYTLSGHEGHFIKAAQQLRAGFTKYKKVTSTGEKSMNGLDKYTLAIPLVEVEEDDRTPQQKWIDHTGGSFGANYYVLPGQNYPHLSISYAVANDTLTFGDAHYSRSHDDSRRLTYTRTADGWQYQAETQGLNHEATKAAADALIARVTAGLNH